MNEAYICDAIRTPIGRFGGGLSSIRADDLAALSVKELMSRNNGVDWDLLEEVVFGFLQLFRSKECNLVDLVFQVGHCKCLFVPGCQTLEQSFPHEVRPLEIHRIQSLVIGKHGSRSVFKHLFDVWISKTYTVFSR